MFAFPKSARLLYRSQFQMLSRSGKQLVGRYLIIEKLVISQTKQDGPKLGITVSRQFGKAFLRNQFKRIVRESFRHHSAELPAEIYINVRPRSYAAKASNEQVRQELATLLCSLKQPSALLKYS